MQPTEFMMAVRDIVSARCPLWAPKLNKVVFKWHAFGRISGLDQIWGETHPPMTIEIWDHKTKLGKEALAHTTIHELGHIIKAEHRAEWQKVINAMGIIHNSPGIYPPNLVGTYERNWTPEVLAAVRALPDIEY